MAEAHHHLRPRGQGRWCAHLLVHRVGEVLRPLLVLVEDRLQHVEAVLLGAHRPSGERLARGVDRLVHVRAGAEGDLAADLFGGRVVDVERAQLDRVNPLSVDVELQVITHGNILSPLGFSPVPSAYQVRNRSYFGISSELALGSMHTCTTPTLPLA